MYFNHTELMLHTLIYLVNNDTLNNDIPSTNIPGTPCFGEYGCFPTDAPWSTDLRPFPFVPESPDKVNPMYCLRTRINPTTCQYLEVDNYDSIYRSHFMASKRLFFIIHGFLESQRRLWMQRMTTELLIMDDVNVVIVDWSGGSSPPYAQAVANIRLVGVMTAHLINNLITQTGLSAKKIHIIGHSLGAHTASYAASHLQNKFRHKIARITGLDAAEPRFSNTDALVRLDPSDADFVDAIHTDAAPFMAGGLGIREPVGHVDFYPNGGRDQPGCDEGVSNYISERGGVLKGLEKFLNCNHVRSNDFFIESINNKCLFMGVQCHGWDTYKNGSCFSCGKPLPGGTRTLGPRCARMGMHVLESVDKDLIIKSRRPMRVFLMTNSQTPFCQNQYRINLKISNSTRSMVHGGEVGIISLTLRGDNNNTAHLQLNDRERYFEPGSEHRHIVIGNCVGHMKSAVLTWEYRTSVLNPLTWRLLLQPRIHVAKVTIDSLENNDSMTLTPPEGLALISKKPLECHRGTPGGAPGPCQVKLVSTLL